VPSGMSGSSSLSNPTAWFMQMLSGGGKTKAGTLINDQTALNISTVWGCVRAIAEDCSRLPLKVYRRKPDGTKELKPDHRIVRMLNLQPNPETTALLARECMTAHAVLRGNGFAEIERTNGGDPVNLWPLHPSNVSVERRGGRIVYVVRGETGGEKVLDASQVFHLRGLGGDGLMGYSVVKVARDSMGLTAAAEEVGSRFFGNASRPSGLLTHPGKLSPAAKSQLETDFNALSSGVQNSGKNILLQEGLTWTKVSVDPKDAQFLETRQFQVPEMCRWFRMKPHKIADLSRATFSNIEHQDLEYVGDCLMGWLVRWEQEAAIKLLTTQEIDRGFFVEHVVAGLLRGDLKSRYDAYAVGRQWGWLTANDILKKENENSLGEEGDQLLVPSNMTTPKLLAEGPKPKPAPVPPAGGASGVASPDAPADVPADAPADGPDAPPAPAAARSVQLSDPVSRAGVLDGIARAFEPVLLEAIQRVVSLEADKAERSHRKGGLEAWSAEFYVGHIDYVRGAVFAAVEAFDAAVRSATGAEAPQTWVPDTATKLATEHVGRSLADLSGVSGPGLPAVFVEWKSGRRASVQAASAASEMGRLAALAYLPRA